MALNQMNSSPSQPPKNFPPIPEGGKEKKKANTTFIVVVVFIVVILAVAYLMLSSKKFTLPVPPAPPMPPGTPSSIEADETGPGINLEEDTTGAIESDLDATNLGDIDSEFESIDEEIDNL